MADIDFAAIGDEFLDGFKAAAEPHLGKLETWASEDQDWLKGQAKLSGELLKDMAGAIKDGNESMQDTIKDAMEQQGSTLRLQLLSRRMDIDEAAREAAGDALQAGLKIAMKIGLRLLSGGLLG